MSSTLHHPLLFFETNMNVIHAFLPFQGGAVPFCNHYLMDFGLMDVYVNDPKKMNQSKLLLEALHSSKLTMQWIAIGLEFVSMALEWVLVKLSIEFCLVLNFQIENFQDLEARANITPCHYII